MKPTDLSLFGTDPWWLVVIKVVGLFVILLVWTIFNVWYERRLVAKMQHRLGPIMNGPFGLGQALADGMKLLIKEDFMPSMVDRVLFTLAPVIAGTAAFTAWAVIPFGGEVEMFGVTTRLQATDLPVSVLVILAVASVGIYGFVLAGWASNSTYSLLGALRSSAQMISYEVAMGLSLVAVFLYSGSMSTSEVVAAQGQPLLPFGIDIGLQRWYWLLLFPSFCIYVISMVGETNRAPFDLPECESELVSGYITEYSGFRYATYFLAEYINMATVSAVATTLFLGGYHAFWPFNLIPGLDAGYWGLLWFFLKVQLLISFFVWLRGTLPRLRYDQFMDLGWKWLIPISLVWIMMVATLRLAQNEGWLASPYVLGGALALIVVVFALWSWLDKEEPDVEIEFDDEPFDAFAGGFPVPPMPGQQLPEMVDVVSSSVDEQAGEK
ncbi:MAG: NADH-quinone oxidoreductase subunit NuoH [Micropruina sp.]|nr:NADH-quinone oxidoreductase subunit NuoH [Micropruina sp.]